MINWKRNRPSVRHVGPMGAGGSVGAGAGAADAENTPVDRPRPRPRRKAPGAVDTGFSAVADTVPEPPLVSHDPSTLGNILLNLGVLTPDELNAALTRQKVLGEGLLGALVCEQGSCTTRDVARAMEIQARLREGRAAEASLGFLSSATEEMSVVAKQLSDQIKGARAKARARGEKTGLFLVPASFRK